MFTYKLIAPFAVLGAVFLGLAWTLDEAYALFFVPCLVIVAVLYIMSPQINWWWYRRNPPELSPTLTSLLERSCGYYARLSALEKRRFRGRIGLFNMGTDWEPLAFPEDALPPDVQMAIAAQAVMLTFHQQEFLFEKFEKVLVFPRPFPTPQFPFDHASELHLEDGCLLFSAEQVMLGFVQGRQWYNVALHEYAKAYLIMHPNLAWPHKDAAQLWPLLEKVSGMPQAHISSVIGLPEVSPEPVMVHHFFQFPTQFAAEMPEENSLLRKIFS